VVESASPGTEVVEGAYEARDVAADATDTIEPATKQKKKTLKIYDLLNLILSYVAKTCRCGTCLGDHLRQKATF